MSLKVKPSDMCRAGARALRPGNIGYTLHCVVQYTVQISVSSTNLLCSLRGFKTTMLALQSQPLKSWNMYNAHLKVLLLMLLFATPWVTSSFFAGPSSAFFLSSLSFADCFAVDCASCLHKTASLRTLMSVKTQACYLGLPCARTT